MLVDPSRFPESLAFRATLSAIGNARPGAVEDVDVRCTEGSREGCTIEPLPRGLVTFRSLRTSGDVSTVEVGLFVFPPPDSRFQLTHRVDEVSLRRDGERWVIEGYRTILES